jgi:hypothetical protein
VVAEAAVDRAEAHTAPPAIARPVLISGQSKRHSTWDAVFLLMIVSLE